MKQLDLLPKFVRQNTLVVSLQTLGRSNPQKALDMLTRIEDQQKWHNTAGAVVSDWSGTDVDSALRWVLTDESIDDYRHVLISDVLRVVASEDLHRAMHIALEHPILKNRLECENIAISHLVQLDIESGIRLLSQVREESRVAAHSTLAYALVRKHEGDRVVQLEIQFDGDAQQHYNSPTKSIRMECSRHDFH
ncbi:MAG: hypothetical protein F4X44_02210 [Gammaproteobacteria bacterium]|nr:hypothetical protein [Gammaproteobacteria bacterium]